MVKTKGALDASTYTKWFRQKANAGMFRNDINQSIPQTERRSIVSRSPAADLPAAGLLAQLRGSFVNQLFGFNDLVGRILRSQLSIPPVAIIDAGRASAISDVLDGGSATL
jgi:hypothetical protein